MTALIWFREDLRIHDNTALHYASSQHASLCAVYFITPMTWKAHSMAPCRIEFTLRSLKELQTALEALHIPLLVFNCPSFKEIPAILAQVAAHFNIKQIFANYQYEVNELARDSKVNKALMAQGAKLHCYHDQTIIAPDKLKTGQGGVYTIFTPYKNAWIKEYQANPSAILPAPHAKTPMETQGFSHPYLLKTIPMHIDSFTSQVPAKLWPAGEKAALSLLDNFISARVKLYKDERDFPSLDSTSHLSPYLATGMLSARIALQKALKANKQQLSGGFAGIDCWISELIWREFYKSILVHFPRVCKNRAFKLQTENLQWHDNSAHFFAWQQGKTGFPLVDAAMRQLNETGWMHNRLRMLTAMFFTKLLWLDWRLGERYFMEHLIDGDFAANNGGWQWSASTGTDAVPYFRIFNPIAQSEKFDPKGEFIRQYCPELQSVDNLSIHAPYERASLLTHDLDYPRPIIDYKNAREYAINAFKNLK